MGNDPFNPLPIDEAILAALVEGDLGGREADAVRERLLAADPALAARIELMEEDRILLRAMGDESPPRGLAESIVARLEREALIGLSEGEPTEGAVRRGARPAPGRRRLSLARLTTPAGAGLAMAAVLALAIGAALQVMGPRRTPMPPIGPIAENGTSLPGESIAHAAPEAARSAVLGEPAKAPPEDDPAPVRSAPAVRLAADAVFTDDTERALALLAEGRLLIRVRSADPDSAVAELGRLLNLPARPGEAYRIGDEVGEPVVVAMEAHFRPPVRDLGPAVYVDDDEGADPAPLRIEMAQPESALEAIYLADTRADAAALASLRTALSLGDGKVAVFEELAEPIDLPQVLTADSLLWWSRAPSTWSRRAYLPVVIERVER